MTQVQVFDETGKQVANSLRAVGLPGEPLSEEMTQKLCDAINKGRADGSIPLPTEQETARLDDMMGEGQAAEANVDGAAVDLPESPIVHKITVKGQDWFPVEMDFALEIKTGLLAERDDPTKLDLTDIKQMRSFTAACLFCGLQKSEKDTRPHFASYDEAYTFARNPAHKETVGELWDKITDINPGLLPGKKN